jgi:hypothetical protein
MPKAVADVAETVRRELTTLPEGFVVLRRLTYGQVLQRQSLLTMRMITDQDSKRKKETKGEFNLANVEVTAFEFSNCIVDHNLEDASGRKLNLGNPTDFQRLDPRVGQEIDSLISRLNRFEESEEDELGNSEPASEPLLLQDDQ